MYKIITFRRFIIFVFLFYALNANASLNVDLTQGIWAVSAVDINGTFWEGSTLKFETQTLDGQHYLLTGYFLWQSDSGHFGRENFTGTLKSNRMLELSGFEIVQPASNIVIANYVAVLSPSYNEILNGSWDGSGIPSDDWSAILLQEINIPTLNAFSIFAMLSILILVSAKMRRKINSN